ncbi:streptamidine family RiPP [Nocardiopsis coralliicola]
MDNQAAVPEENPVVAEIEEPEQLAHLSASHSNALVENPFD